ncbi:MAG: glycoside hydrolase family 88 protein [Capsulimonadaceae bacterium]
MSDALARSDLWSTVARAALAMPRKDWEQGVLAQAFLEVGDLESVVQMCRSSLMYRLDDGRLSVLGESGLIDCAMLGEALAHAAAYSGDPAIEDAERRLRAYLLAGAARSAGGTLYHAGRQFWVDSYNCAGPYLASVGHVDEALAQMAGLRNRLWNPDERLFAHIWDDERQSYVDPSYWGVGNGWAAFGLSRVIASLPDSRSDVRQRLVLELTELLDGLLPHLREDGLFHNVVDRPETFVETNLAQMTACVIYRGIAGGWVDDALRPSADRMRLAARSKVDRFGFVQGVCAAPAFDRPGIAPEGQAFFLLMETAAALADMS